MRTSCICLVAILATASGAHAQSPAQAPVPQPSPQLLPLPAPLPAPQDTPWPGTIVLSVDASDTTRSVVAVHEIIPVSGAGDLVLLYPEWIPGHHSPVGRERLDRLAGLTVVAGRTRLPWSRDPVNMFAFHIDVPSGVATVEVDYQYLSPPPGVPDAPSLGPELLTLDWDTVVLYPAGHFARRITVQPRITLPEGWRMATALRSVASTGNLVTFAPVSLDVLVDSPLYAGRNSATLDLAQGGPPVRLNLFADRPEELQVAPAQLAAHRALVQQAYRLFGSRHYDHYDFLVTLSATFSVNGTEHHRSSFDGLYSDFFSDWSRGVPVRNVLPHEYVHSWNGKYRRPADLWTPNYNVPMRNSLLWVYEGMTQYWADVLTARSGLWSREQALDVLAVLIARYQAEPGREWRTLQDTTDEPIINYHSPQTWSTWQRGPDYYRVGQLIWLDADTLIRERSGGRRSLDDFAREFFGTNDDGGPELTYTFDDVVAALNGVLPYDWGAFLRARLEALGGDLPLDGVRRGGYRFVYTDTPSEVYRLTEERDKLTNLAWSIGLTTDADGKVRAVMWKSPAWQAGLAPGTQVLAVNGYAFDADRLKSAVRETARAGEPLELIVRQGDRVRTVQIEYHGGLRYPHLVRDKARPALLDRIYAPRG